MRFWQKTFLISLTVLTVAINAVAYLLIQNNHRLNLEKEISSGLDEYSIMVSSFQTNVLYERYRSSAEEFGEEQVADVARNFSYLFSLDQQYIQLNGKSQVYSNFPKTVPNELLESVEQSGSAKQLIEHKEDGEVYLYISSPVVIQSSTYLFTTIKDISNVYRVKNDQLRFFSLAGPAVSVAVALILLVVSVLLTRQINRLRRSTKRVADGDYQMIPIRSNDEIGMLTADFNQMTQAIRQKVEQLEHVAEDRKSFIDNMTHEMKTPLTSIIGFSDLLRSARLDADTIHDYAQSIYKEGQYLKSVSSKLMEYILLKQAPELRDVPIRPLLEEIAAAVGPIAANHGVIFTVQAVDFTLHADRELLRSMIYNFIDNAIKASQSGQEVALKAEVLKKKQLKLLVSDHGSGIPQEETQKIFEPFYRVDKARSRQNGGAGLGLALCAEIAQVHHARITIDSQPGQGTTISILFPEEAAR
ncbi:MAG TPA: HAMP domain-containing histidine kinase [Candidatus Gallacutalibacter stercoravium]|nr:HAMP domain-containing histidine kinase [Candidatus Gallacutalibacter stercoravium]